MPLAIGTQLGSHEITALLGKGGMGEVYRARDLKLKREVAIKILPEEFSRDADRVSRFQREAEVLASLNHPNIAAIHDLEETEGTRYLVLEFVEGETLADRLMRGPIPLDEAVHVAKQIVDALEAAHERGIVHRDLKPGNIKIGPDGKVKVLDFGLAKVALPLPPAEGFSNSPTLVSGSVDGVILGTAPYMSPEQARGKLVDARTDIWAFGCVLYEMLSGQQAFTGETTTDILAKVLEAQPKWNALLAETPSSIRFLLETVLNKDPKQRLHHIADVRPLLNRPPTIDKSAPATAPARGSRRGWFAAAGALSLALAMVGWDWWRASRPVEEPPVRLMDVDLGSDISLASVNYGSSGVIISSDGTRIVYLASVSGSLPKLLTRRLDQPKAAELPGTEGANSPFFSPDGQWVGFVTGTRLNKISVEGGAVVPLGDLVNFTAFAGANWGEDGNIIIGQIPKGLVSIPSSGGVPSVVTELATGELSHAFPQILPGGKAVLFAVYTSPDPDNATIQVVSLADRRRKTLVKGGTSPRYLPSGHLVYSNKGTLFAIPFDLDRLETRGTAIPVLEAVSRTEFGAAQFDFSRSGTMVYRTGGGGETGMMTVQWLDGTSGKKEPLWAKPGIYTTPRLSPDGKRLALSVNEGGREDVWVYDPQRAAMERLTLGGGRNPTWSRPTARYIVFTALNGSMSWTRADGSGQPQPLTQSKNVQVPSSFSPDGKWLAYSEIDAASRSVQIWILPVEDNGGQLRSGKPELFRPTQFTDAYAVFSPDGKWLAYQSNDSGRPEVLVRAFPAPAAGQESIWRISNSGGEFPAWLRSSQELLYQSGDQIMAVKYSVKSDSFEPEKPTVWVAKLGGVEAFRGSWDLALDGKRLAVVMPVETTKESKAEHEVVFLENFFGELRTRVPLKY